MRPSSNHTRSPLRTCSSTAGSVQATVAGTTYGSKSGVATFRPSIALSTVMAGVITPSP